MAMLLGTCECTVKEKRVGIAMLGGPRGLPVKQETFLALL